MSNYKESKQKLDTIRNKYGCKGEIIFRTAIQYIVEYGQHNFLDEVWYEELINDIDDRHDTAEKHGKWLFVTRDFEKAILKCAKDLAQIEPYDLLIYIQKEVWLGGNRISYQRAIELLQDCINSLDYDPLNQARDIGFEDDEIEELGYGYMFDEEEEYE